MLSGVGGVDAARVVAVPCPPEPLGAKASQVTPKTRMMAAVMSRRL
jgi:hypothetical protein